MSSNVSPSTGSSELAPRFTPPSRRSSRGWRSWPIEVFLPIAFAALLAATSAPLMHMLLGDAFGLTGGRTSPSVFGLGFVILIGCWGSRLLDRILTGKRALFVTGSVLLWFLSFIVWFAIQPDYDLVGLLEHPASLSSERGYFVIPLFLSLGAWWIGSQVALDAGRLHPEETRGLVTRCWLILTGSIVLAALVGDQAGDDAIRAATLAVPVAMIASVALVAGVEIEGTRQIARRRGSQIPGWKRWYRLVGGFSAGILVFSLILLVLLSPSAMEAILDAIVTAVRWVGWLLGYVIYAVIYLLYWVIKGISWLVNLIFGDVVPQIQAPESPAMPAQEQIEIQQNEPEPVPYADLLRWIGIGIALIVVGLVIFRMTRSSGGDDGEGALEEERDSVFSSDLAKKQLRDLFRRRHGPAAPKRLDLDHPPSTPREAMIYLEVLAQREGIARETGETPWDFAERLRGAWPGTGGALNDLVGTYNPVRYGEGLDDPDPSLAAAWREIWTQRKPFAEATART